MARTVAEANSILARIEHMPFGPARTQAAATEAARVEADGPEQCLAYSLNVLIASYTFTGEQEKAYVPFSRLVKLYDTRPDLFDEKDHYDLQWAFKWMVNGLSSFPGVSAERIDAAIADMESRFGVDGIGAKTVIRSRYFWALHRYGKDAAEPYFQKWLVTPNDNVFGTECDMCTCNTDVFHSIEADDWEDALAKFDTALADPENPSRCFQEPAAMGSALLPWLARRGQPGDDDRARTLYRRVREQADADPTDFVAVLGRMVQFLASSGHPKRALRYLEKNSKWLVKAESPLERLQFVSRVAGGLRLLVEHYGMGDTAVSISEVPAATVSELHQWTARETRAIAAEFDARNGTATVSQRAEQVMAANPTGRVLDLTLRLEPDGADTDGAQQPITASVTTFPGAAGTFDPTVANSGETAGAALAANQSTSEQDAQAALDTAEDKARHGDVEGAVSHYVAAASAYRAAGRLRDAGFAYAEAAAHTYNLDDPDTAAKLFGKAFDILYAVDTALPYLTPMMGKYLSALFDSSQHGVATEFIADFDKRMADAMADSERKLTQSGHADDHSSQEWLAHQRLEAAYCEGGLLHSRMAAEAGDIAKAARIAEKSGERLAGFGNINLACDAFCTAGALFAKLGDDHASYCYESAMEAAGILNQRNRRVSIGDTLITLLKSQGREEEASELASRVAGLRP